jgi:hypothetical protein
VKYGSMVFKESIITNDNLHREIWSTKWTGAIYFSIAIYGLESQGSKWSRDFYSTWSTIWNLKSKIGNQPRKGYYKRYTIQVCVPVYISKLLWTNARLGGARNTNINVFEKTGELPIIIWICRGIGECVGWSTTIIFTSRKSKVGSNKVHSWKMKSWICGFGSSQIIFKSLCILWGRRTCNYGLSFCAFSHQSKYY